jgi:hypothetical protein
VGSRDSPLPRKFGKVVSYSEFLFRDRKQEVESTATPHSEEWYLDLAIAIKTAGWTIPKRQVAACPACTASRGLRHDPRAFSQLVSR